MRLNTPLSTSVTPAVRGSRVAAWVAGLVWLGVGLSAVGWGLKGWPDAAPLAQHVVDVAPVAQTLQAVRVAQALGAASTGSQAVATVPADNAAARFVLTGVVQTGKARGVALLAVDGQMPRPYRVGAALAPGWVLQSVQAQQVQLGAQANGPSSLTLTLPQRETMGAGSGGMQRATASGGQPAAAPAGAKAAVVAPSPMPPGLNRPALQ